MKVESLGLNHWLSLSATCHTVSPSSSALSSGHLSTAPPNPSSGMPRCSWYQAASALLSSFDFRNTPPIPVTLAIVVSCCLALAAGSGVGAGPDGKFVAARFGEVETPAAREREYRLDDLPARFHDPGERAFEILAVEHDERAPLVGARGGLGREEAAIEPLSRKRRIVGPVIDERPAEGLFEEALGRGEIPRGVFHVIDLSVLRHGRLPGAGFDCTSRFRLAHRRPIALPAPFDSGRGRGLAAGDGKTDHDPGGRLPETRLHRLPAQPCGVR